MFSSSNSSRLGAIAIASALLMGCSSSGSTDDSDAISDTTPTSIVDGGATGEPGGGAGDLDLDDGNVPGSSADEAIDDATDGEE